MRELERPLLAFLALAVAGGAVFVVKKAHAQRAYDAESQRYREASEELARQDAKRAEVAAARAESGSAISVARDEKALLARALPKAQLPALLDRLRETARGQALGKFEAAGPVRVLATDAKTPRLSKVTIQLDVVTDWPRLGALLAEVRALEPLVAIEKTIFLRADEVPNVGARFVLATLVASDGTAAEPPSTRAARFDGPNPFFLESELASGKSHRRIVAPWTPPRVELEGIVYVPRASQVIVNGAAVSEGKTFTAGSETVKVLEVLPLSVRFQAGERIFERELAPLSKGGKK